MEQKTYLHKRPCRNCREIIKLEIPFGKSVDDYFKENPKCPKCGCNVLDSYKDES